MKMQELFDKNELFAKLKAMTSKRERGQEIRVDILSFPSDMFRLSWPDKMYWVDIIRDTDLLERFGNLLAPGHFECYMRTDVVNPEDTFSKIVIWTRFFPVKRDPYYVNCCHTTPSNLVDNLCGLCGALKPMIPPVAESMSTPPRRSPPSFLEPPGAPPRMRRPDVMPWVEQLSSI